jgi:hypothetical protein
MRRPRFVIAVVVLFAFCAVAQAQNLPPTGTEPPLILNRPLYVGVSGGDVSALQELLKALGYFTYPVSTGYFGSVTWQAVVSFQKDFGVDPIGIVGPATRGVIARVSSWFSRSSTNSESTWSPSRPYTRVYVTKATSNTSNSSNSSNASNSTFSVADQTIVFGALTLAGAGSIAPTATGGDITGASITSGNDAGHWQIASNGVITPTATGDSANLNQGPYALTISFNGGEDTAVVTVNVVSGAYSVAAASEYSSALTDIDTASAGTRSILFRAGSYGSVTVSAKSFVNTVTFGKHSGQSTRPIFSAFTISDTDKLTLDDLEITNQNTTSNLVLIINGSDDITIKNSYLHGKEYDLNGDYSGGFAGVVGGIASDGTTKPVDVTIQDNTFRHLMAAVNGLGASGSITIIGNDAKYFYEDGFKVASAPSAAPTVTISDNDVEHIYGNSTDSGNPHPDFIQFVGSATITSDWTGVTVSRNRLVQPSGARGDPAGIFEDNIATSYYMTATIRGNLVVVRAANGIRVNQAKSVTVEANTVVRFDAGGSADTSFVPGINIGPSATAGTHLVRYNVAEVYSISGTATSTGNITLGTNGATIAYAAAFDGLSGGFQPDDVAEAMSMFAIKDGGSLDVASQPGAVNDFVNFTANTSTFPWLDTPDALSFTDVTDAGAAALTESNHDQITGVAATGALVSVTGDDSPEFKILASDNSTTVRDWGTADAIIQNNQYLALRETSASSGSTAVNTTINVGTRSDTWTITTAAGAYAAVAADFDGTNDYLSANAGTLTFGSSTKGTLSFWFYWNEASWPSGTQRLMDFLTTGGNQRFTVSTASTGRLTMNIKNSAGTILWAYTTNNSTFATQTWYHFAISWDAATNSFQAYKNGVSLSPSVTVTNDTPDWTNVTRGTVGAANAGTTKSTIFLADLYLNSEEQMDLASSTVLAKFISGGKPVDLGTNGSTPSGNQPEVFLSGAIGSWQTNKGTAGGFTENGDITTASSSPSD